MELKRYWEIICRKKWIFLLSLGIVLLFALIPVIKIRSIYKAAAYVRIEENDLSVQFLTGGASAAAALPSYLGKTTYIRPENLIGTYQVLFENKEYLRTVIQNLNLRKGKNDKYIEVKDFINPGLVKLIMQKKGVSISQVPNSETFEIGGYSESTKEAEAIANTVADAFQNFIKEVTKEKILRVLDLIEREIYRTELALDDAEKELEIFKKEHQIAILTDQKRELINQKTKLETELYTTQRTLAEDMAALEGVKEVLSQHPEMLEDVSTMEDNQLLTNYRNVLLDLERALAKESIELSREHPTVKGILSQIEHVKGEIKREVTRQFSLQVTAREPIYEFVDFKIKTIYLKATEMALSDQIEDIILKMNEMTDKEMGLNKLSRSVDALKTVYTSLLSEWETAKIAGDMDITNITILEKALIPEEDPKNYIHFPKKSIVIVALFMGSIFGLFVVFVLEYLDDSVRTPDEVKDLLEYPVIGVIPKGSKSSLKIFNTHALKKKKTSLVYDRYLDLRSSIELMSSGRRAKIMSVVSSGRNEGKTTICSNLAYIYSFGEDKVLLIDCNLRGHSTPKGFNAEGNPGLSDFLQGKKQLDDIIESTMENLDFIPSGPLTYNPLLLLESDRMSTAFEKLGEKYDLIMVDTPPLEKGNDLLTVSRYCDKVLFVIASGETSRQKIRSAAEQLQRFEIPVLGVVLNKARSY